MPNTSFDALDLLACPVDKSPLTRSGDTLVSGYGRVYPVVDGVPVLLRPDVEPTIGIMTQSLKLAREHIEGRNSDPCFIDSLGISDCEKAGVCAAIASGNSAIDPVISYLVSATNGILYKDQVGKLERLPIPCSPLPPAEGEIALDIGCSWGRWSIAAALKGYRPIGLDPSLGAVLAAKRLALELGLPFTGIVADARHLPLMPEVIDSVFSYSVMQHFSKRDAIRTLSEVARVTRAEGLVKIQMASATGMRSVQHIVRRRFREPRDFEVRYWMPNELRTTFRRIFGNAHLEADCFFGLGLQLSDAVLMKPPVRALLGASEVMRRISLVVRPLAYVADSVYLSATNAASPMPKSV